MSTLTFQGTVDGVNTYKDLLTGEEKITTDKIADALGNNTLDSDQVLSKQGATTFVDGVSTSEPVNPANVKYDGSIAGRSYVTDSDGTSNKQKIDPGSAPRSNFNAWSLFRYKSKAKGNENSNEIANYDGAEGVGIDNIKNPTAGAIVEWAGNGDKGPGCQYTHRDFIQCEHYGSIPNNYMITLRRFPFPVPDDIYSPEVFSSVSNDKVKSDQPDIARAITWMSPTLENNLKDIFSFGTGFNWKDIEADVQTAQSSTDRGKVGSFMESNPILRAVETSNSGLDPVAARRKQQLGSGFDPLSSTYPNHVYGPLNVIKNMMIRDRGLTFDKEFTLNFYYDMKAYGNTSPKAAFMDTITNLLVLTSNNAPFWGGAVRGVSNGQVGKPFGDISKLASGDIKGFLTDIKDDFSDMASNIMGELKDLFQNGKTGDSMNALIGDQLMDLFGSPQGATVLNAFLTGDPTGQWHLTIGNPMNPAMVVGNLGLQSAKFEFDGPLGFEDFPTKLKVTITLKPGRPRDKADIESMFNVGKGRIYIAPEGKTTEPDEFGNLPLGVKDGLLDPDGVVDVGAYGNIKGMNAGMKFRTGEIGAG